MKFEPVMLVAPRGRKDGMPTRRAWMMAGMGALIGGACGYAAGSVHAKEGAQPRPSTHDPMLAWLRELAADTAPSERLTQFGMQFLLEAAKYPDDVGVQSGVARLAKVALEHPELERRNDLIDFLLAYLQRSRSPHLDDARHYQDALRAAPR